MQTQHDRWLNQVEDDQGFFCYCPRCEDDHHTDDMDIDTGLIYCECGKYFVPEE